MYYFVRGLIWLYFTLFHRVRIEGLENVPRTGPVLMLANHPSTMDMFTAAYRMPRKVHFMAKAELFSTPFKKWFFTSIGAFPVNRGKGDIASVRNAIRILNRGGMVGIFPEGTRTKARNPARKKGGASLIALNAGAPVLPVGIDGETRIFGSVRIVIGRPFRLERRTVGEGDDIRTEIVAVDAAETGKRGIAGTDGQEGAQGESVHPGREELVDANELILDRIYGLIAK